MLTATCDRHPFGSDWGHTCIHPVGHTCAHEYQAAWLADAHDRAEAAR